MKPENCLTIIIDKYPNLLSSGKRGLKQNIMKLKKIKNFLIILLKLVFSDNIIDGYWMEFMPINAVTDLKDYLFCFKKEWRDNTWK